MLEWLKKTHKPQYRREYEVYLIVLFSINLILAITNSFLFFLRYGKEFNIIFLFGFVSIFLLLNFYYALKGTKQKQFLIFLNVLFFQYLMYELIEEEIYFIIPKILFFKILKTDFLILFFIIDILLLFLFYYLNVFYPKHRYE